MSEANQRSITLFFGAPKYPRDENSMQVHSESRPSKSARIISPTLSNSGSHHSLDSNLDKKDTDEDSDVEFISISTNKVSTLDCRLGNESSRAEFEVSSARPCRSQSRAGLQPGSDMTGLD